MASKEINLIVTEYDISSEPSNVYAPLQNIEGTLMSESEDINEFQTSDITINNANVEIEIQESYDNSVNLLINDKKDLYLVNSGFEIKGDELSKVEHYNQHPTNIYNKQNLKQNTALILSNSTPISRLTVSVNNNGNLMGGNYFLYLKYGNSDGDATDFIEETRAISIFNGDLNNPDTISGALLDERTDKSITLSFAANSTFSKVYLYYSRETSDLNGVKLTKIYRVKDGYDITGVSNDVEITLTGNEEVEEITSDDLNIHYLNIASARSMAQHQGMLFLANLTNNDVLFDNQLAKMTLSEITLTSDLSRTIYDIDTSYKSVNNDIGYYSTNHLYNDIGYWPNDFYRIGIVYTYNNGQTSCVYNLRGGLISTGDDSEKEKFQNDYGVFYTGDATIINSNTNTINPLKIKATLSDKLITTLAQLNIVSYFFVRQSRVPINIAQGLLVGVDTNCGLPGAYFTTYKRVRETGKIARRHDDNSRYRKANYKSYHKINKAGYWLEGFLLPAYTGDSKYVDNMWTMSQNNLEDVHGLSKTEVWYNKQNRMIRTVDSSYGTDSLVSNYSGLLCLDATCVPQVQNLISQQDFYLTRVVKYKMNADEDHNRLLRQQGNDKAEYAVDHNSLKAKLLYIPEDTPIIYYNGIPFSTRAGAAEDTKAFSIMSYNSYESNKDEFNPRLIRGTAHSFIGIGSIEDPTITNANIKSIDGNESDNNKEGNTLITIRTLPLTDLEYDVISLEILKRKNDNSPFRAISNRYPINYNESNNSETSVILDGGDCYVNTVTLRLQTNFIDPETPNVDLIVNGNCWDDNYKGIGTEWVSDFSKINRSDLNAVPIGTWITYKCLSNYNLMLRSEDKQHADEINKLGNPRSFYPLQDINIKAAGKVPETSILNQGYSTVLSHKHYFNYTAEDIPYVNTNYTNRIAFSNKYIQGSFENGYRVFQGLSYRDYTREYGQIVKIISYSQNLFVVFEHGCGIVPVNEKALIQTTVGQNIHMYGAGVLGEQITVISSKYGSRFESSIIMTDSGIYGVDTDEKVIWRYNSDGFVILSEMKINKFLSDQLILANLWNSTVFIGLVNVKTHYNIFKRDVMFTFYNKDKNLCWNLCFNEKLNNFICKYTWTPLLSENVGHTFYSFDLNESNSDTYYNVYKSGEVIDSNYPQWTLWNHGHNRENESKILPPTKWYNKAEPFEFEFIVNQPLGLHKIFDNLVIISNNAQPNTIEIEIVGDAYDFNKYNIITGTSNNDVNTRFPKINIATNRNYQTELVEDSHNRTFNLRISQDCLNTKTYGRRLGNIQYLEDRWNYTIQPIYYSDNNVLKTTRIRDKYAKVKIKYTGQDLAVITAIQTLMRLSYA